MAIIGIFSGELMKPLLLHFEIPIIDLTFANVGVGNHENEILLGISREKI